MSFDTIVPYAAAGDLSALQYHCVKDNGSGAAAAIAANTDVPIGILQNEPNAAGKSATIAVEGVAKGILGGTVAKGDHVGPDAAGKLIKRTLDGVADPTKYVIGIAGDAGVVNDVIPVRLTPVPFRAA